MDLRAIINHDTVAKPRRDPPEQYDVVSPAKRFKAQEKPRRQKLRKPPVFAQKFPSDKYPNHLVDKAKLYNRGYKNHVAAVKSLPQRSPNPANNRANSQSEPAEPPRRQSSSAAYAPLMIEPWEANIVDRVLLDQLDKLVGQFLFMHVISTSDLGPNATYEVEAKLGNIVDRTTNERLMLPVLTDTVIDKQSAGIHVQFKSSMTENHHREFNKFLNDALMKSLPPKDGSAQTKPRVRIDYKHIRQVDTFYELSEQAMQCIPPAILGTFNPRQNRSKVRITTDQITGEELAKIIKIRIADMDVYCPTSPFDWRVSVNIEVNYDGPTQQLVRVTEGGKPTPPRRKDRMTYSHLAYQIDLTQVTVPKDGIPADKEHELEIEITKMDDFRSHGKKLITNEPNAFEQIVRGFLDNVRLLQRHITR